MQWQPRSSLGTVSLTELLPSNIPPPLVRAWEKRGIHSAQEALGQYPLLPFHALKGLPEFVKGVLEAIDRQEPMVVVADYDCDGATACTVAVTGLRALGATIDFVVPNRFIHGYGLTPSVVDVVKEKFPSARWIVTVDNGIASVEGVDHANRQGLQVLITDHHLPGSTLPKAAAIVNPNQPGCPFPSKNLAGCGVMMYALAAVREALMQRGGELGQRASQYKIGEVLDVVALGSIADVVKLDTNNRWLVRQGLQRIRSGLVRPGVAALFHVAKKDPGAALAQDFGFALGPRINAAGRLDDMATGIKCLLATSIHEALPYAEALQKLNEERKSIELTMKEMAWQTLDLESQGECFTRVAFDASFHEGVIGIVAGRIKEKEHVPTIVFAPAQEPGLIKGSGRSIPGIHLRDILDWVHKKGNNLLHKFGGHSMAAGLTLEEVRLPEFKILFEAAVQEWQSGVRPNKVLLYDEILDPKYLTVDFADIILSDVWGQGFEEPVWVGDFEVLEAQLIGAKKNHVKMRVRSGPFEGEAMHFFSTVLPSASTVKLAYTLSINQFRGNTSLNLLVVDRID